MREARFPKLVAEVVATLADIFRHQGVTDVVELLESANARFDEVGYDNWNGGTYTWALRLEVPVAVFASVEPRLPIIEQKIGAKLGYLSRSFPNDHLDEVTVSPLSPGAMAVGQRMAPSEIEVRRLWPDRRFRLFLSHVSKHKIAVAKLKEELALRGVAAFIAHEDIEPSLDWQREIELALRSMNALAALITADFHASHWTDQELGWALGRGLLVLPVRLGTDPYGFAGKVQAVSGALEQSAELAASLVNALMVNPQTQGEMRRTLVSAFCEATSFAMAVALRPHVTKVMDFTEEEKTALWKACTENIQVSGAFGVREAIYETCGRPPALKPEEDEKVPF